MDSISLHRLYTEFLKEECEDGENTEVAKELVKKGFKKFVSNRFGRLCNLSKLYLLHKPLLGKFFQEVVDENSNKLWMASYCYLNPEWFTACVQSRNLFL